MTREFNRRGFLAVAGAAGLLTTVACSTGSSSGRNGDGGVTVEHAFGRTTISSAPSRVVSAGLTGQDSLLALGVVPVATTEWFGGQPFAVWPWAQPKLGAAHPKVLTLDGGIQIDRIAALKPDLIVATNAGLDADTYQKLSAIAPTIAQSGSEAFFEPWREQAGAIGRAVFQEDAMKALIGTVDDKFTAVATANGRFKDRRAVLLQGTLWDNAIVATMPGWRTDFLTRMGFTIPDSLNGYARGHRAVIPVDQAAAALDSADVLIWSTESEADQAALLANPAIAALPATAQNRNIFTGKDLAGAIAFASVLSYPMVAEQLPPLLTAALR